MTAAASLARSEESRVDERPSSAFRNRGVFPQPDAVGIIRRNQRLVVDLSPFPARVDRRRDTGFRYEDCERLVEPALLGHDAGCSLVRREQKRLARFGLVFRFACIDIHPPGQWQDEGRLIRLVKLDLVTGGTDLPQFDPAAETDKFCAQIDLLLIREFEPEGFVEHPDIGHPAGTHAIEFINGLKHAHIQRPLTLA